MTSERRDPRVSIWVIAPVALAVVLAAADFGDRFWGSATDSRVTSYQVTQLTEAVKVLAGKFDGMPKQAAIDALLIRLDKEQTDQQRHWDQINQTFEQIGRRFVDDELAAKGVDGRVAALERSAAASVRNPPR